VRCVVAIQDSTCRRVDRSSVAALSGRAPIDSKLCSGRPRCRGSFRWPLVLLRSRVDSEFLAGPMFAVVLGVSPSTIVEGPISVIKARTADAPAQEEARHRGRSAGNPLSGGKARIWAPSRGSPKAASMRSSYGRFARRTTETTVQIYSPRTRRTRECSRRFWTSAGCAVGMVPDPAFSVGRRINFRGRRRLRPRVAREGMVFVTNSSTE